MKTDTRDTKTRQGSGQIGGKLRGNEKGLAMTKEGKKKVRLRKSTIRKESKQSIKSILKRLRKEEY